MKKIFFLSPFVFLLVITPVLAANQKTVSKSTKNSAAQSANQVNDVVPGVLETEDDLEPSLSPDDDNNDVGQAKNSRSQNAYQHMSIVAQSVKELLETKIKGGIGEQVREIARQQNQSQEQTQQNLKKVESRHGWLKKLFGADKKALKNLNNQMDQNQLRLEQLTEVQTQLSNQSDLQTVQLAVETLTAQNTALQQVIEGEEQIKGIFSWLTALFAQ